VRGRLISPFIADIAQLDTSATEADPDGSGPLTSGYDPEFNEVVKLPSADPGGASARVEKTIVQIPCQVEVDVLDKQDMAPSGDIGQQLMRLVFHFEDLEDLGLVQASGQSAIGVNDRLVAIRRCPGLELVREFPLPEGMFIIEAKDRSFGLSGGERNLLVCTLQGRDQGLKTPEG
jgi:hypothetical protein